MTTLSTHVLDTERGAPAAGVSVVLYQHERQLARSETNTDGRIPDLAGGSLEPGVYRLVFEVAAYFERRGIVDPFLHELTIAFRIAPSDAHCHVPLLLAAYACTSYRGS